MRFRKAQNLLEYGVLFAVAISALMIMQVYVKRSYQGRLKREADSVGQQYAPGKTASKIVTTTSTSSSTYTGTNGVPTGMSVSYTDTDSTVKKSERVSSLAAD